ncbi:hypothetical protein B0H14DRAFT_3432994 [Mycena olivaceomarginata]|nr:hypothetical protein B0H14DRAFT_3432994 [Mycena olivaceomarginata]
MTTRPPCVSSRSSSSQNERRSLWPNLLVTIPDVFSRYSGFKYRLWFIWYIWHLWSESWRSPPWSAIICGSDGNGDLWLWEDEDEEYIKVFTENIPVFPELLDWHTACWYLKERLGRTAVAATPLAHLTPPNSTSLRCMAPGGRTPSKENDIAEQAHSQYHHHDSPLVQSDSTSFDWRHL